MIQDTVELYSPHEIARAAGVPVERVFTALGRRPRFVVHDEAVRIGRSFLRQPQTRAAGTVARPVRPDRLFAAVDRSSVPGPRGLSFVLSSTAHVCLVSAIIFLTSLSLAPAATTVQESAPLEEVHLVFLTTPGPGGGGGGGGSLQPRPAPKALRMGKAKISSPLPVRREPKPIEPVAKPPEPPPPPPPLQSEPLPVLVAPIVSAPADLRDRIGVVEPASAEAESHGSGRGGGAGTGDGTGLGSGTGPGVGPGSGGGTGGGPYRPGSGIAAPRLLREVKADYTEDARRRGVEGEVVMEIVITRTGSVGDVKILRRLDSGLDARAVQAVRQWQFAPATRQGAPVDVIVQVGVEFRLR